MEDNKDKRGVNVSQASKRAWMLQFEPDWMLFKTLRGEQIATLAAIPLQFLTK